MPGYTIDILASSNLNKGHHPEQRDIGLATDLDARLAKHNSGGSPHTSKFLPWELEQIQIYCGRF